MVFVFMDSDGMKCLCLDTDDFTAEIKPLESVLEYLDKGGTCVNQELIGDGSTIIDRSDICGKDLSWYNEEVAVKCKYDIIDFKSIIIARRDDYYLKIEMTDESEIYLNGMTCSDKDSELYGVSRSKDGSYKIHYKNVLYGDKIPDSEWIYEEGVFTKMRKQLLLE